MKRFEQRNLEDLSEWTCLQCGSKDVADHSPEPNVEDVYQEVPDGSGDVVEKVVSVATEHYISLECNACHAKEFEAL